MERSTWTDERIDDRFDHIDAELVSLRGEITELRSTMLRLYGGNVVALFGLIAAIFARGA